MPFDVAPHFDAPATRYGRTVRTFTADDFAMIGTAQAGEWGEYVRKLKLKGRNWGMDCHQPLSDSGLNYTSTPGTIFFDDGSAIRVSIETRMNRAGGAILKTPVTNWRRAVRVAVGYWRHKQAYARQITHRVAEHLPPPAITAAALDDGREVDISKANAAIAHT